MAPGARFSALRRSPHALPVLLLGLSPLVMLWPLPLHLGSKVAEHYFSFDALLTADNIATLAENLVRGLPLWDGRFYHPVPGVLALTEPDLVPAILVAPFSLAHEPLLAHNLAILVGCAATALSIYALAFHLTREVGGGDRWAAAIAAMAGTWSAPRWSQIDHLNYLFAPFAPLALLFLLRAVRGGRTRDALLFAAAVAGQALTCVYLLLFLAVCLPPVGLVEWLRARRFRDLDWNLRFAASLGLAAVLCAVLLAGWVGFHRDMGLRRDYEDLAIQSGELQQLHFADPVQKPMATLLPDKIRWDTGNWPGAVPLLAPLVAFLWLARRRALAAAAVAALAGCIALVPFSGSFWLGLGAALALIVVASRQRLAASFAPLGPGFFAVLLFAGLAFVVFWGPEVRLPGRSIRAPFWYLWQYVPGFDGIRAVRRAAVFLNLGLAVAAAPALALLLPSGTKRRLALVAVAAVAVVDGWAAPLALRDAPALEAATPGLRWLATRHDGLPAAELPFETLGHLGTEARWLARLHGHPILNGHSGFAPPFSQRVAALAAGLPAAAALDELQRAGARYLVLREERLGPAFAALEDGLARSGRAHRPDGAPPGVWLLDEGPKPVGAPLPSGLTRVSLAGAALEGPGNPAAALDGDRRTRWASGRFQEPGQALTLVFPRPEPLAALTLDPGPDWPADFPRGVRVSRSDDGASWTVAGELPAPWGDFIARPARQPVAVPLDGVAATRWRIELTGGDRQNGWGIAELGAWRR